MTRHSLRVHWHNIIYLLINFLVKIKVTEHLSTFSIDCFVLHLPDGEWTTVVEGFNSVFVVHIVVKGTGFIITLCLEDGLLNSSVGKLLFKSSIEQGAWTIKVLGTLQHLL